MAVAVGDVVIVADKNPALVTQVLGDGEVAAWGPDDDGGVKVYERLAKRSPEDYDEKGGGGTWWFKD